MLAASMGLDAVLYNKTNGSERMEAHRGPSMLAASMGLDAVLYNKTNGSEGSRPKGTRDFIILKERKPQRPR